MRVEICRDRSQGRVFRGLRFKHGARRLLCVDLRITERPCRAFLFLTIADHEGTFKLPALGWSHLYHHWATKNPA